MAVTLGCDLVEDAVTGVAPRFFVAPTDRNPASEIERQATFRKLMRQLAPGVLVYANTNGTHIATRGGRMKAGREGRTAGVPDLTIVWNRGVAWLEMKAGKGDLRDAQVEIGNRLHDCGHHVACHRDPVAAVDWLRSIGCPVMAARR